MGLGPELMGVGDRVFTLHGGELPVILRAAPPQAIPTPTEAAGCNHHPPEQVFQLVGTSYVHGLMDGEALDGEKYLQMDVHLV